MWFRYLALAAIVSARASAGEIVIGRDALMGGTKIGTCHLVTFSGPAEAIKAYEKQQKERFERVDPAVSERLGQVVSVSVNVSTYKQHYCAQYPFVPQKIVITPKDGHDPILTITLTTEEVKLDVSGTRFTVFDGSGTATPDEIRSLAGRDLDFHLVVAGSDFKDKWKAHYADQILGVATAAGNRK